MADIQETVTFSVVGVLVPFHSTGTHQALATINSVTVGNYLGFGTWVQLREGCRLVWCIFRGFRPFISISARDYPK